MLLSKFTEIKKIVKKNPLLKCQKKINWHRTKKNKPKPRKKEEEKDTLRKRAKCLRERGKKDVESKWRGGRARGG